MTKTKKFSYFAIVLIVLAVIASFSIDIKTVVIIFCSLLLLEAYVLYKDKIRQELIVAFLFSLAITSYYFYEYTTFNIMIGKLNLFPIVSWTFGLVLLREVYERIKIKNKFFWVTLFYIVLLIIVEYLSYNFLNIQLNSNFPGLWKIDAMHSPWTLKIIYFITGPIYLWITNYLKVKWLFNFNLYEKNANLSTSLLPRGFSS